MNSLIFKSVVDKNIEDITAVIHAERCTIADVLNFAAILPPAQAYNFYQAILSSPIPEAIKVEERLNYLKAANNSMIMAGILGYWEICANLADYFTYYVEEHIYLAHIAACAYAQTGQFDKALQYIELAIQHHYDQMDRLEHDPALAPIQHDPRFKQLIQQSHKKYTTTFNKVPGHVPVLLKDFANWLGKQPYGAVGYFDFQVECVPPEITDNQDVIKQAFSFMTLPDGSLIILLADGTVMKLDSEGAGAVVLADNLKHFLQKLATSKTGVQDLDEVTATQPAKQALQQWLSGVA